MSHPNTQRPAGLCVYGAGNTGRRTVGFLAAHGTPARAIIDRNATPPRTCGGMPVVPLSEASGLLRGADVVTAIFNRDFDFASTRDELLRLGASSVRSFVQWFGSAPAAPEPTYWLDRGAVIPNDVEERCLPILADDKSVRIFNANMHARRAFDDGLLSPPDPRDDEYLPSDIPALSDRGVFRSVVDAGAYDGDTLDVFVRLRGVERAPCFEPDARNFAALERRIAVLHELSPGSRFDALPYGLWNEKTVLRFHDDQGEGSALGTGGSVEVRCAALDDVLPDGLAPTFVKMDIEGAEPEALRGARRTVERFRPHLALCVYHRPDHLWTLMLELASWGCGYSFHLRSFGFCGFDTVLFAVPR